jgi:hypothetical protein
LHTVVQPDAPGSYRGLTVALALLGCLWFATIEAYRPAAPRGMESFPTEFSATRAVGILSELVAESAPHPIGSAGDAVVRERIVRRLQELGYQPELQSGVFVCDQSAICGTPTNIVVRIDGAADTVNAADGTSVLIAAHYDSVPAGPGASDDGAGVATTLEIARILKLRPRSRHSIILLIDEGEEAGLLGAELFVQHHRWARGVKAAVNLDARGTSGPSFMFETGDASRWLMRLYADAIAKPLANSAYYSIYKNMPNGTDFTVFKAAGYQGFNFAFIGGVANYHTPQDDARHADARSIQQQGEQALATLLALANSDLDHPLSGEAVYFDLFGQVLVRLPQSAMLPAAVCESAWAVIFTASLVFRRRQTAREVVWAFTFLTCALLSAATIGELLLILLRAVAPTGVPAFAAHPWILSMSFTALAVGIIAALSMALRRRVAFWGLWYANTLLNALLAVAVSVVLPGASYLMLLPGLLGLMGLALRSSSLLECASGRELAALAYILVMFTLLWPIIVPLYAALGTMSLPLLTLLLVFGGAGLAGLLLDAGGRAQLVLGRAAAVLVLLGLAAAAVIPVYSLETPQAINISYQIDHASAGAPVRARWLILTSSGHLPGEFGKVAHLEALPGPLYDWSVDRGAQEIFSASASLLDLSPPQLTVCSAITSSREQVHYRVRIASDRGAPALLIAFPLVAQTRVVSVSPVTASEQPVTVRLFAAAHGWQLLRVVRPAAQGVELSFDAAEKGFEVMLTDKSYGLPPEGVALQRLRPHEATSLQDGDVSVVTAMVRVEEVSGRCNSI